MSSKKFLYGKDTLTSVSALKISNGELKCEIGNEEIKKINTSRENIKNVLESNQMIYGINTGFGALCNTIISNKDSNLLQENLLKSHAVGVGPNVPTEDGILIPPRYNFLLGTNLCTSKPIPYFKLFLCITSDFIVILKLLISPFINFTFLLASINKFASSVISDAVFF